MISFAIRAITFFLVTFSVTALGQALNPGHYSRTSSGVFPAIDISTDATGASVITMDATTTPSNCSGSTEVKLVYSLSASYKGETVNYTTGTCTGQISCGGNIIRCSGVGPAPATFAQPQINVVTANSTFWGGVATFESTASALDSQSSKKQRLRKSDLKFKVIKTEGEKNGVIVTGTE